MYLSVYLYFSCAKSLSLYLLMCVLILCHPFGGGQKVNTEALPISTLLTHGISRQSDCLPSIYPLNPIVAMEIESHHA